MKEPTVDYRMYQAHRVIIKYYNRVLLKPYDISYQHYLVLMVLFDEGAMPVLHLGDRLAFQSGTITPIIKKMASKNLIRRVRSEEDERVVIVELTDEGRELIISLSQIPVKIFKAAQLSPPEYEELMRLTNKIVDNMH